MLAVDLPYLPKLPLFCVEDVECVLEVHFSGVFHLFIKGRGQDRSPGYILPAVVRPCSDFKLWEILRRVGGVTHNVH